MQEINKELDTLYTTKTDRDTIVIRPHLVFDGDGMTFLFRQEDDKFARLALSPNYSEWMADLTGDWKKAAPTIEKLAAPYGVRWDNENGILYIRFRRNEMSITQAMMRLHRAALVAGNLDLLVSNF